MVREVKGKPVHLLYLDDAGAVRTEKEQYFVLGGVCLHESQVQSITGALDRLAAEIDPTNPEQIEFHASEIFSARKDPWQSISHRRHNKEVLVGTIKRVLGVLSASGSGVTAFASVVHKSSTADDAMDLAFSELVVRFNHFLIRNQSYGLIILDESTSATRLRQIARHFRTQHPATISILTDKSLASSKIEITPEFRVVDGPLFVSSRAFRCVQLADHVAYAAFRRYEARDANYFDVIAHKFDQHEGIVHGLYHWEKSENPCLCPACLSREIKG